MDITPDGNTVVIGGKNKQGKSSLLDCISYALGGKKLIPDKPVRTGADEGKIVVKLDGDQSRHLPPLVIERTFSAEGTTKLEVKSDDGYDAPSPQALLDGLWGRMCLDPLEFTRLPSAKQMEALRGVVGLDFTDLDAERKKLYDQRTTEKRTLEQLKAQLQAVPPIDGVPEQEVSVAELMEVLGRCRAVNAANAAAQTDVENAKARLSGIRGTAAGLQADIRALEVKLDAVLQSEAEAAASVEAKDASCRALIDQDIAVVESQISQADTVNAKVRQNKRNAELKVFIAQVTGAVKGLSDKIDAKDAEKAKMLAEASWPVPGLSFGDGGVLLNGLPFEQASQAEQLEVAISMALAANPVLRVLLIRDGSLMDEDTLATVGTIAETHDAQVWIERVSQGAECSVILENGIAKAFDVAS